MPRLIRVFAGSTCHFVGFVMWRLILVFVLQYFWINFELSNFSGCDILWSNYRYVSDNASVVVEHAFVLISGIL